MQNVVLVVGQVQRGYQGAGHHSVLGIQEVEGGTCLQRVPFNMDIDRGVINTYLLRAQDLYVYLVLLHELDDPLGKSWGRCLVANANDKHVDLWLQGGEETEAVLVDVLKAVDVPGQNRSVSSKT